VEPSGRLRHHFRAPKSPSAAPRPTFQPRVELFIERLVSVRHPKKPSTDRQPESELRVENVTELHSHLKAPKNPSATHRPDSELQETHRARPNHLKIPKDPSTTRQSNQSFQGTLQRTPDLYQESEESINKALSRFRELGEQSSKLLDLFQAPKNLSEIYPLTFRLSWSTSTILEQPHESEDSVWLSPTRIRAPAELIRKFQGAFRAPKSSSNSHLPASQLSEPSLKASDSIQAPKSLSFSQKPIFWVPKLVFSPQESFPNSRRRKVSIQSAKVRAIMARQRTALPWGLLPLRRVSAQAATCAGLASPDCAAPSGFLNLLTLYSTCAFSALFHAESIHGVLLPEVSPSQ